MQKQMTLAPHHVLKGLREVRGIEYRNAKHEESATKHRMQNCGTTSKQTYNATDE